MPVVRLPLPRIAALGALLFCLFLQSAFAEDRFSRQVNFDIAAQTVEAALLEFSKQADVQVMVGTSSLNGQKTEGVKGRLSVTQAGEQLLKDTGLEYQAKGNTVTVRSVKNARADAVPLPRVDGMQLASRNAAAEAASRSSTSNEETYEPSVETLDEILVTGTHIRGQEPPATVLTISPTEIAQTGYATIQDWIDTLPQNFSGVPNEENGGGGNFNKGTSVNLRGLGSGTTLVLVNGRRQPVSGTNGDFVDISTIPASAIERVEILTDGASALYGSDAIGGVVNIILRKDFDGAESKLRYAAADGGVAERTVSQLLGTAWTGGQVLFGYQYYDRDAMEYSDRRFTATTDKRAFGGDDFRSPDSNPGNIYDPFTFIPAYGIPPGQDGRSLTSADLLPGLINLQNQFERAQLLPDRTMHSAFLSASQRLAERFEVFAEGRYSERRSSLLGQSESLPLFVPDSNPFFVEPFGGLPFAFVGYSFADDFGPPQAKGKTKTAHGTVGLSTDLPSNWKATLSTSWGQEKLDYTSSFPDLDAIDVALADPNPETAFNPFGDGSNTNPATLATLRLVQ
ncbi:MAG: TonB-dependent receptor plug domain-containing protein, partial [Pseudomonas fluorescens]